MLLQSFGGSLGLLLEALGGFWEALGNSLGTLDRPQKTPRFVLGLSWVLFTRLLLPKMALGGFWGRLWLVFGAPEGLLRAPKLTLRPSKMLVLLLGLVWARLGCFRKPPKGSQADSRPLKMMFLLREF